MPDQPVDSPIPRSGNIATPEDDEAVPLPQLPNLKDTALNTWRELDQTQRIILGVFFFLGGLALLFIFGVLFGQIVGKLSS